MAEEEIDAVEGEGGDDPGGPPEPMEEDFICEEGAPGWVVTFGDMMSLLLTFFILLLSFATLEKIKYKILSGSIQTAFGVQEIHPTFKRPQARKVLAKEFSMQFNTRNMLDGMKTVEERQTARTPSGRVDIEVFEDYRGIVISVGEDHMFEKGKADLRPAIWPFLDDVLRLAVANNAQMQVEAHTDSIPIKTARFRSNDHLAAARSVAVIRYLKGIDPDMPPHRLEAIPAGESRPRFVNLTEAGRKKNRRVELVFYRAPEQYQFNPN